MDHQDPPAVQDLKVPMEIPEPLAKKLVPLDLQVKKNFNLKFKIF